MDTDTATTPDPVEEMRAEAVEEERRITAVPRTAHRHPEIVEKAIAGGWDEASGAGTVVDIGTAFVYRRDLARYDFAGLFRNAIMRLRP